MNTALSRAIDWLRWRLEHEPAPEDVEGLRVMLKDCESEIPPRWNEQEIGYADELEQDIVADLPY
jgi:hypothetical protein